MDARDFFAVARSLAEDDSPASRRSALSRAYYAAYHAANELLASLGIRLAREHRGHERLRAYLANSGVTELMQVGAQLRDLHNLRVKADYWLLDPHPERADVVALWLTRTERMLNALEAVAQADAVRQRAQTHINAWHEATVAPPEPPT